MYKNSMYFVYTISLYCFFNPRCNSVDAIAYTYLCTYFLYIYLLHVEIISAQPNSMVETYAPRCDSFIHVNDANLIYLTCRVG